MMAIGWRDYHEGCGADWMALTEGHGRAQLGGREGDVELVPFLALPLGPPSVPCRPR